MLGRFFRKADERELCEFCGEAAATTSATQAGGERGEALEILPSCERCYWVHDHFNGARWDGEQVPS